MSRFRVLLRRAVVLAACLAAGGCSMLRHETRPAAPAAPARPSAAAAPPAASSASSVAASGANWDPSPARLDPEALVGHTWVFPSSSPVLYGEDRFAFKRDRVEASNAREHATGTWTVEHDKLCVRLNAAAWGTACYVVTGSAPGALQIRVLPDGDRVPLKIQ